MFSFKDTATCSPSRTLPHVLLQGHCHMFSFKDTATCSPSRTLPHVPLKGHCHMFSFKDTATCSSKRTLPHVPLLGHCHMFFIQGHCHMCSFKNTATCSHSRTLPHSLLDKEVALLMIRRRRRRRSRIRPRSCNVRPCLSAETRLQFGHYGFSGLNDVRFCQRNSWHCCIGPTLACRRPHFHRLPTSA